MKDQIYTNNQDQLRLIEDNKKRVLSKVEVLEQKVIGVNKNYNAAAKGIETFKKDMSSQVRYLKNDIYDTIDKKFALTGLDNEVAIMDNE